MTTPTTTKGLTKIATGDLVGAWGPVIDTNWDIVDSALGGVLTLNLSGSSITLTQAQAQNLIVVLTGALTANVTVTWPSGTAGLCIVQNSVNPGNYKLSLGISGGSSTIAPIVGCRNIVLYKSDGVYFADDRTNLGYINTANGWALKFSNGYVRQGGLQSGGQDVTITYPFQFSALFGIGTKIVGRQATPPYQIYDVNVDNVGLTGFNAGPRYMNVDGSGGGISNAQYYWWADGIILT